MKKLSFFLLILAYPLFLTAQNELLTVFKNGKWGAINNKLEQVIPFKYSNLVVENNCCIAKKGFKYGLIDKKEIGLLKFEYDTIRSISNDMFLLYQDSLVSFYNLKTREKSKPVAIASNLKELGDGIFTLKQKTKLIIAETKQKNIYTIDADAITLLIKYSEESSSTNSIFDHLEVIKEFGFYTTYKDSKKGITNLKFEQIIAPEYDKITLKKSYFEVVKEGKIGLIGLDGKILIPPEYSSIQPSDSNFIVAKNGLRGFYNSDFKQIMACKYNWIVASSFGMIVFFKDNCFGFSNAAGKTILLSTKYKSLKPISPDYLFFKDNNSAGIISKKGKIIFKGNYDRISFFPYMGFITQEAGKKGFVDFKNKYEIKPEFTALSYLNSKHILVEKEEGLGVYSSKAQKKIDAIYTKVKPTKHLNIFKVQASNNDTLVYISKLENGEKSQFVVKGRGEFTKIENELLTLDSVVIDYKWGVQNSKGQLLLETIYKESDIEFDFDNFAVKVKKDTSILIVNFGEDGSLIDKTMYNNFLALNIQEKDSTRNYGFEINSTENKANIWKKDSTQFSKGWGLFSASDSALINYRFHRIDKYYFYLERKELVLVKDSVEENYLVKIKGKTVQKTKYKEYYGVVNQKLGKITAKCEYFLINNIDFKMGNLARGIDKNVEFQLIDTSGIPLHKKYTYIGSFKENYARVNIGGYISYLRRGLSKDKFSNYLKENLSKLENNNDLEKIEGKWGVLNNSGAMKIEPIYDYLSACKHNEFKVRNNDKWGIITPDNLKKVNIIYDTVEYFNDSDWSMAPVNLDFYKVKINKKWGVVSNNKLIAETIYDEIKLITGDSLIYFKVFKDNLVGMLSSTGIEIVPVKYTSIEFMEKRNKTFFLTQDNRNLSNYVNKNGKVASSEYFYNARKFKNNFAAVAKQKRQWNFIDKNIKMLSEIDFFSCKDFQEKRAAVLTKKGWGFIDTKGKIRSKTNYKTVGYFNSSRAIVKTRNGNTGFINLEGKEVVTPRYDAVEDYRNGYAIVTKNDREGLVDFNGRVVLKTKYTLIPKFKPGNFFIVKKFEKRGLASKNDGIILKPKFNSIYVNAHVNIIIVRSTRKKYGFYSIKGKRIQKPKYRYLSQFNSQGVAVANSLNNEFAVIDTLGNQVVAFGKYRKIYQYKKGLARVSKKTGFGFIDSHGNESIEPKYREASDFVNGYSEVKDKLRKTLYIDKNGKEYKSIPKDTAIQNFIVIKPIRVKEKNRTLLSDSIFNLMNIEFEAVGNFADSIAVVAIENKGAYFGDDSRLYGLINQKGYYVCLPMLASFSNFRENYALFKHFSLNGLYDSKGNELLETKYGKIEVFNGKYFKVSDLDEVFYLKIE